MSNLEVTGAKKVSTFDVFFVGLGILGHVMDERQGTVASIRSTCF